MVFSNKVSVLPTIVAYIVLTDEFKRVFPKKSPEIDLSFPFLKVMRSLIGQNQTETRVYTLKKYITETKILKRYMLDFGIIS